MNCRKTDNKTASRKFPVAALVFSLILTLAAAAFPAESPLKKQFDSLALPVLERGYATAVLIAVRAGGEEKIFGYGTVAPGSQSPPDKETIFEIGSVTKTFTALLLAVLAEEGRVNLDDPINNYLPASGRLPGKDAAGITLAHLASHTSGLPRIPAGFGTDDPLNPYAGYDSEMLYAFLSAYELPHPPGQTYRYSNLGSGLLGHLLTLREKEDLETLIREKICRPLGMGDTGITVPPGKEKRLAPGYDLEGNPVAHWDFAVLAGCGALRSTGADLLKYLRLYLDPSESPLSAAVTAALTPRSPTDIPGDWRIGLAWHLDPTGSVGWHDGGTYGAYAYIGFNRKRDFALIWLSNGPLWQLGGLRPRLEKILLGEAITPLKLKKPVDVAPRVLEKYTGRYRIGPDAVLEVTLVEGYLVLAAAGKPGGSVLYPSSKTDFFFLDSEDLTVSFAADTGGRAKKLILIEGGETTVAEKIP